MTTVLAALPLLITVGCMVGRMKAHLAALVSVLLTTVIALWPLGVGPAPLLRGLGAIMPTLLEVVAILLGGVLLSQLLTTVGAQGRIAGWIGRVNAGSPDRAALLMVLGVTPFAESVTGFGMGAVVATPLLLRLGFGPTKSIILALLGLFLTTWGALAPGTLVAAALGGVDVHELAVRSGMLALWPILVAAVATLMIVNGPRLSPVLVGEAIVLALLQWAALAAANLVIGPALAGAIAGLVATLLMLGRLRLSGTSLSMDRETARSLLPYGILVVGLLGCTLAVRGFGLTGPLTLLTHGSVWLAITCLSTGLLFGLPAGQALPSLIRAVRSWWRVALATGAFLAFGALFTAAGMSSTLAAALAGLGDGYLLLAPVLAGLSGFVAGSNAGANAMFSASQAQTAAAVGASTLQVVAVQNLTSGVLTIAAPSRVALAITMSPEAKPGPAYRWLLGVGAVVVAGMAVISLVL